MGRVTAPDSPVFALTEFLRLMREVARAQGPLTPGETVPHVEQVVRTWRPPAEVEAAAREVVTFLRGLEAARGQRGPAARVGIPGATLRTFSGWVAAQLQARQGGP